MLRFFRGQLEIPQDKNLVVYKVTGLGEAQAFEVMTYTYALDSQVTASCSLPLPRVPTL